MVARRSGDPVCRRILFSIARACDEHFYQTNLVTELRQLTCPVVRAGTPGAGAVHHIKSGRGSVMPVWRFMDDLPADHSHCSGNVAEPSLINGEGIGGQDGEVRQLAGLQ